MRKLNIGLMAAVLGLSALLTGCDIQASPPTARQQNAEVQASNMDRATAAVPAPRINNFLAREALAKLVKRMDEKGKLFYVYVLANNGQQIGYYVANTRPISTCAVITPPDDVWYKSNGSGSMTSQKMATPSLGGTYGGACTSVFFFDAATDAYIEISDQFSYFVSDQPLGLDVKPIKVQAVTPK